MVKIIEGTTHYPHQENYEVFNKVVLEFLLDKSESDHSLLSGNQNHFTKDILNKVRKLGNSVIDTVQKRTTYTVSNRVLSLCNKSAK